MSTMNDRISYSFSPLYRIKRILIILRWGFGFPLKARNIEYNELVFEPFLENIRYLFFLFIFFISFSSVTCPIVRSNNLGSFFNRHQQYFKSVGFTSFDILVAFTLPFVSILSTFLYFYSFRKHAQNISKISLNLTNINKEISNLFENQKISSTCISFSRSVRLISSGIIIAVLIQITELIIWFIAIQDGVLSTMLPTDAEKVIGTIAFLISNGCWVYPSIAMSADLITCHLLQEIGEAFEKWNTILKIYNKKLYGKNQGINGRNEINDNFENDIQNR